MSQLTAVRTRLSALLFGLIPVLGALAGAAFAGPGQWPPITDAERAVKECPGQPGAPAVYLYRQQTSDHNEWTFSAFARLKILTPAGKDYGTIEIPFSDVWEVKNIWAAVIRPDGRAVPFSGEIFEKTVLQVGRLKRLVKTFALPDLDVGSIIEYGYELKLDLKRAASAQSLSLERWEPEEGGLPVGLSQFSYVVEIWDLIAPLYTFKAKYTYIPFRGGHISFNDISLHLAWVSYGLVWGPPTMADGRVALEVTDIPARAKEEWAAPEEDGRMGVIFFLCSNKIAKAEDYWRLESAGWQSAVERFLKENERVAEEARTATAGSGTLPERTKDNVEEYRRALRDARQAGLAALYARAQSIRNLSYDPGMTPERRKELKIKDNRNAGEVLKRDAGLRSDITRTFVALARAAGFEADVARVVTRDDKFFHENILALYGQFDTELAIVDVDGREMFCDPATPGCPLGLVRWNSTDTIYLRSSGPPGAFATIPPDPPERSRTRWTFDLSLGRDGGLSGSGVMACTGQDALALRLEYLRMDEAAAGKSLGEKLTGLLPAGGTASVRRTENLAGSNDELRAEFDVTMPAAATAAGDRLLLPVMPFRTVGRDAFRHAGRAGPVYFPYLFRESDDITIAVPDGLKVEAIPAAGHHERSFADYSFSVSVEGSKIRIGRELLIGKNLIPLAQYPVLKSLFDQIRAGDESQIVLSVDKKRPRLAASGRERRNGAYRPTILQDRPATSGSVPTPTGSSPFIYQMQLCPVGPSYRHRISMFPSLSKSPVPAISQSRSATGAVSPTPEIKALSRYQTTLKPPGPS